MDKKKMKEIRKQVRSAEIRNDLEYANSEPNQDVLDNVDETDVVNVSLILNEKDKHNLLGTGVYEKIAKELDIEIYRDSDIFDEIERFIVYKFYEMEDKRNYELSKK